MSPGCAICVAAYATALWDACHRCDTLRRFPSTLSAAILLAELQEATSCKSIYLPLPFNESYLPAP